MRNYIANNIKRNWMLDAIQEDGKYFFNYEEVNQILSGRKCYVIGRKGMGKSAICKHIVNGRKYNTFTQKLTFKNFPFNELYELEDNKYARPNQYITLWKYLIYASICKMMIENESVDVAIREKLQKAFPPQTVERLYVEMKRILSPEFELNLGVFKGSTKMERKESLVTTSWIDRVEILENFIIENCTTGDYFIVFDELDEDYRNVKESGNWDTGYIPLLTGLLKAVQNIKSIFSDQKYHIKPVVFLRSDIYGQIRDADKNKWSDYKLDIEWGKEKLKKLMAYRIRMDCHEMSQNDSFESMWFKIFDRSDIIHFGSERKKTTSFFDYICKSTMLRPRDLINYIRSCCEEVDEQGLAYIDETTVLHVDRAFSNYLKNEIYDEIYPVLPDIDVVYNILSSIRKQILRPEEFIEEYNQQIKRRRVVEEDVDYVLETLFNYSIIGNQHRPKDGKTFFKYQQTNMTYNRNESIVIHRGLLKSLQIE